MSRLKKRLGFVAVFGMGMLLTPIACNQDLEQRSTGSYVMSKDEGKPLVEDCFSSLISGEISSAGKMSQIYFASGSCQGDSKAITKMSNSKEVTVISNGQTFSGPVEISKDSVYVIDGSQRIAFAKLHKNPSEAMLILDSTAKVSNQSGQIEVRL